MPKKTTASLTQRYSLFAGMLILPYITYCLPMGYSLFYFPTEMKGPFNLGVVGWGCRLFTVLWSLYTTVLYSFPYYLPVTGSGKLTILE